MISRNDLTTEYLTWPLEDDQITVDSDTTAEFAFMVVNALGVSGEPATGDWQDGIIVPTSEDTDEDTDGNPVGPFSLAILIGPSGGLALSSGLYRVWVRITDTEERPVRALDWLEIR